MTDTHSIAEVGRRTSSAGETPVACTLTEVVDLATAEYDRCMFFRFAAAVDDRGAALEVTAPPQAIDLVHVLVGAPS